VITKISKKKASGVVAVLHAGSFVPTRATLGIPKNPKSGKACPVLMKWFLNPIRASMRRTVRSPTRLTRRKLIEIKGPLPRECFEELMKDLQEGDADGIERRADGVLLPTSTTTGLYHFKYLVKKPTVVDKLWALESTNLKTPGAYMRGSGCARLNLPTKAHLLGRTGTEISMVAGLVSVEYKQPWRDARRGVA
jgi:hypothetical protein